jgi:hypothetical protein
MDNPATPRPTIVLRLSVTLRWPALRLPIAAVARRAVDALPRPRPLPAVPRPSSDTLRRIAALTTKAAIALILLYAILLVTAAPAYGQAALRSGLWDLASLVSRHTRPDVSSPALSLVVASIVVLAVVSSHSGRGHDRW